MLRMSPAGGVLRWLRCDFGIAVAVFGWITVLLVTDPWSGLGEQRAWGAATWGVLLWLLRAECALVRTQVAVVVVFATAVEYTFSHWLEVYVYRLDNVPAFVPPGHGLVYLCALALGRSSVVRRWRVPLVALTLVAGMSYALWGLLGTERVDVLGAFWFACLVAFLRWGRSLLLYVGAFAIVTYLELLGTWLGVWEWQPLDPTGLIAIGNPPSGAAGGYAWFDVAALTVAPALLHAWKRLTSDRRDNDFGAAPDEPAQGLGGDVGLGGDLARAHETSIAPGSRYGSSDHVNSAARRAPRLRNQSASSSTPRRRAASSGVQSSHAGSQSRSAPRDPTLEQAPRPSRAARTAGESV